MKRMFDFLLAIMILSAVTPVMIVLTILIRRKMGSPVIFRQQRPGLKGKPFHLYKFRSMTDARDDHGELLPDEQRMTALGRFLRKSSLDELPQLLNVLKGELSFVGPRPLLMEYLPLYSKEQARRHDTLPGITGWAQINGRNAIGWEEKFALDVWYVDHCSFFLDMRILVGTFLKVFRREGVSAEGHVTMPKFTGTSTNEEE